MKAFSAPCAEAVLGRAWFGVLRPDKHMRRPRDVPGLHLRLPQPPALLLARHAACPQPRTAATLCAAPALHL